MRLGAYPPEALTVTLLFISIQPVLVVFMPYYFRKKVFPTLTPPIMRPC
jgi:hypothetical protein